MACARHSYAIQDAAGCGITASSCIHTAALMLDPGTQQWPAEARVHVLTCMPQALSPVA